MELGMDHGQLQHQLKLLMEERGVSGNRVAAAVGVSPAVISGWLKDSYSGDAARIDELVSVFLEKEKEKSAIGDKKLAFVQTSGAKRIFEALRMCHIEGELGVVYGDAGCGKTRAVKEYSKRYKDALLIEADLGFSAKILFKELHQRLGFDGKGNIHDMFEDCCQKLNDTGRLLIIDEAEHLPYRALELLRRLFDKAGIGVALVGMPRLVFNLRGRRGEFAQLYSRVGIACSVSGLKETDVEKLVHTALPGSNGIWENFYKASKQNARHLSQLIYRSKRIAEINNCKISAQVITRAAEMLLI